MSLSTYIFLFKRNRRYQNAYDRQILIILCYPVAQCWVKGAMELEGEQLEYMAKNRKCLQAVRGEVAAHRATCLQPGQLGWAFGSVGRVQSTDLHPTAQQHCHGTGASKKIQISVVKGRSAGFSFSLLQRTLNNLAQMERLFFPSLRFRNWDQIKLVTARMCVLLLCLPWWLYGLHVLILEVTVPFLFLPHQISTSASGKGTAAYLGGLSQDYIHYSTKIPPDSEQTGSLKKTKTA